MTLVRGVLGARRTLTVFPLNSHELSRGIHNFHEPRLKSQPCPIALPDYFHTCTCSSGARSVRNIRGASALMSGVQPMTAAISD